MKQLKVKNYLVFAGRDRKVASLSVFLSELMLHGKESRARTKFLKLIVDQNTYINEEKTKMLEGFCKKNDKGEMVYITMEPVKEEGKDTAKVVEKETTDRKMAMKYAFKTPEDEEKFEKEWQEFMAEEFVIDILPSNNEMVYTVRDLVLNTNQEFSDNNAILYSEWCDSFEGIGETEEKKEKVEKK